jgi:hypothetical protein
MISASNSRAAVLPSGRILASLFLLVVLCAPQRALARPPQSTDASPAPQQSQDPAKKEPVAATPATPVTAAAAKAKSPKPNLVFTNDDLSPSSGIPIAPGARRRLKQLNRCDHTCFNEVKKQAINYGYINAFPRSTREEMDDRLANTIEEVQNDPKWQRLLLEMISAHIDSCLLRQKNYASPEDSPTHTPTRPELLDEEERMKNYRPAPSSNYNAANSAALSYRFNSRPDPLRQALMFHQYMDESRRECPVMQPAADSEDDSEDP